MVLNMKQVRHIEQLERLKSELGELEVEVKEIQAKIKRLEADPIERGSVDLAMHRKLLAYRLKTIRQYCNEISKVKGRRPR